MSISLPVPLLLSLSVPLPVLVSGSLTVPGSVKKQNPAYCSGLGWGDAFKAEIRF